MDSYHPRFKADCKIKFKPNQAAMEAGKMLGHLHQQSHRGKALMFAENLDRDDDTEEHSQQQIQYSVDDEVDFNAGDLSKGISFGVAHEIQQDAELQVRNRIRETIASVKNDQKSINEIKKCIF